MKTNIKKALFKYGATIRKCKLYNGQKMFITNKDKGLSKDIYLNGIREENALKYFLNCIDSNDVVLDLGANMGFYSIQEALIAKKVINVEPVTTNFSFLVLNTIENNLTNIENYNIAISDTNRVIDFFESEAGNLSCLDKKNESHNYSKIKVISFTGQDFLKEFDVTANVLRMDVEGAELEVLESFGEKLKDFNKIFLEVHEVYLKDQVLKLFRTLGKAEFNVFWYVPDEKRYGKYEKQIVSLHKLATMKREGVYHLFCFKGGKK